MKKKISDYPCQVEIKRDLWFTEISRPLIDDIADIFNLSKVEAKVMFFNALQYNIVVESIIDQVQFMLGDVKY